MSTKYLLIRSLDLSIWYRTASTILVFSDSDDLKVTSFVGSFTWPALLCWTSFFTSVDNTATRKAGCIWINNQSEKAKPNHFQKGHNQVTDDLRSSKPDNFGLNARALFLFSLRSSLGSAALTASKSIFVLDAQTANF